MGSLVIREHARIVIVGGGIMGVGLLYRLAAGRLVKPFDVTLTSNSAYFAVCPKSHLSRPEVSAFRTWLLAQAADTAWTGVL